MTIPGSPVLKTLLLLLIAKSMCAGAPDAVPWHDPQRLRACTVAASHIPEEPAPEYALRGIPAGAYKLNAACYTLNEEERRREDFHEIARNVTLCDGELLELDLDLCAVK